MHHVHLHREPSTRHGVFAGAVEVVLDQFVRARAQAQGVAVVVADLDGVAVVDAVSDVLMVRDAQRCRWKPQAERRHHAVRRGHDDVDRRLLTAVTAGREGRVQLAPAFGSRVAVVMPHRISGGRGRGGFGRRLRRRRTRCKDDEQREDGGAGRCTRPAVAGAASTWRPTHGRAEATCLRRLRDAVLTEAGRGTAVGSSDTIEATNLRVTPSSSNVTEM